MDKDRSRITQEAVLRLLRAEYDDSTAARAEFVSFARASVHHVRELLLAQATLRAFDQVDPRKRIDLESLPKLPELPASVGVSETAADLPRRSGRRAMPWLAAAAVLLAAVSGWLLIGGLLAGSSLYVTEIGEQRFLKLEDGSTVVLNTDSRMRVDYSPHSREVHLLKGEALFQVAHEAARPFQVHTDAGVVQALGTQFNVYRQDGATRVAVVEGAVQISPANASASGQSVRLDWGDEARFSAEGVTREPQPDVSRAVAWRSRHLMFDNVKLEDVAREFNRYNRTRLSIEGDALKSLAISGAFDVDDVEPIVRFIERTPGLNAAVIRGRKEIVIRPR